MKNKIVLYVIIALCFILMMYFAVNTLDTQYSKEILKANLQNIFLSDIESEKIYDSKIQLAKIDDITLLDEYHNGDLLAFSGIIKSKKRTYYFLSVFKRNIFTGKYTLLKACIVNGNETSIVIKVHKCGYQYDIVSEENTMKIYRSKNDYLILYRLVLFSGIFLISFISRYYFLKQK